MARASPSSPLKPDRNHWSEAVRNDLFGLSVTGRFAYFPSLATERVQPLGSLDPMRLAALLEAAETAHFFTRAVGDTPTPPDARSYHLRLSHAGRFRTLAIPELFATPETITDEDKA